MRVHFIATTIATVLLCVACDSPTSKANPFAPTTETVATEVTALATTTDQPGPSASRTPSPHPSAHVKQIVFMAYNLKNYLHMDRNGTQNTPKPETEIQALVDQIVKVNPDILGVCEIGTESDLRDLQNRLIAKGLYLTESEFTGGGDPTRRLALLSRYPITDRQSQKKMYYRIENSTLPFQRGILDATVWISPTYQLRFLGAHLKSQREVTEAPQDQMRASEAQLMRDYADKLLTEDPNQNILLYGDLNDNKHSLPIKIIKGSHGTPLWFEPILLQDANGEVWTHYWSTADSYSRLDYAMASNALIREVLPDKSYICTNPDFYDASDHRPLVIIIHPENLDF